MTDRRSLPQARPIYLGTGVDAAFAMYHAVADGVVPGVAVLIAPPWGWDDVSSYRTRRTWADDLAEAGHPTLRIDLPGTGDSGGTASDPDRIEAAPTRSRPASRGSAPPPASERVAVLGLGFGGIVAASSLASGASIDDLVLWAVPARGRGLVRQLRAFAGLQGSRYSLSGEPEPSVLPDGWLEVNGFVLSAETITALEAIELTALPAHGLGRVLLLDQDGIAVDPKIVEHFTEAGAEVTGPARSRLGRDDVPPRAPVGADGGAGDGPWLARRGPSTGHGAAAGGCPARRRSRPGPDGRRCRRPRDTDRDRRAVRPAVRGADPTGQRPERGAQRRLS